MIIAVKNCNYNAKLQPLGTVTATVPMAGDFVQTLIAALEKKSPAKTQYLFNMVVYTNFPAIGSVYASADCYS